MANEPPSRYQERMFPEWVKPLTSPPFTLSSPRTQREKLGIRYEQKVHSRFLEAWGFNYIPAQWWKYFAQGRIRYCQTDGILLCEARKTLLLVEIKYSHTADAYWQVEHVYIPVLSCYFRDSGWQIATVEVVKWYDPAVSFPVRPVLREFLENVRPGEFSVHILNR